MPWGCEDVRDEVRRPVGTPAATDAEKRDLPWCHRLADIERRDLQDVVDRMFGWKLDPSSIRNTVNALRPSSAARSPAATSSSDLFHEARHTFASLLIAAGVNVKAISTYIGHASVKITLDRYGHLMPNSEEEASTKLDEYLVRASRAQCATLSERITSDRTGREKEGGNGSNPGQPCGLEPISLERRLRDSNACTRLCRPLPNHSAKAPRARHGTALCGENPLEERGGAREGLDPVRELCDGVALVIEDQQFARDALVRQDGMDVLGLRNRHPRVVAAVLDEERRTDCVDVGHRRRLEQELPVVGERAVLPLACGAPVVGGVLEERHEARDADGLDPRRPELGLEREGGEHHVAAVGAAVDDRARAVDLGARAQPPV